jgi:hypothetical protein
VRTQEPERVFKPAATKRENNDGWTVHAVSNSSANGSPPPVDNSRSIGGTGNAFNKNANKRSGNCCVCGEAGHFSRDRKKATASDQNSSMSAEDARQARGISAADSPADVCMRSKVNGMPTFALLDTGITDA